MTYKEAIDYLPFPNFEDYGTYFEEAYNMAIDTLAKADEYRWHDLRKDPSDLPKKDGYYLCRVASNYYSYSYYPYRVMKYQPSDLRSEDSNKWIDREISYVYNHFVIAWKEIEVEE